MAPEEYRKKRDTTKTLGPSGYASTSAAWGLDLIAHDFNNLALSRWPRRSRLRSCHPLASTAQVGLHG
jgi:hypothetical protein